MTVSRPFASWMTTTALAALLCLSMTFAAHAEVRKWKDKSGKNTIEAEFVSQSENKVKLRSANGRTYEIEITQLSTADRDYLKTLEESPFKEVGDSPFMEVKEGNANGKTSKSGVSGQVIPDWSDADLILVEGPEEGWKYSPPSEGLPKFKAKNVALPKAEFGEHLKTMVSNNQAKRVALGVEQNSAGKSFSRVILADIMAGRLVANQQYQQKLVPISIHPDGQRILLRSDEFGFGAQGTLRIDRVEGKGLVEQARFEPYADEDRSSERDVKWAEFVGDNQILTCSRGGRVALWSSDLKPVVQFHLKQIIFTAGVSPDRRYVAIADIKNLYIFDTETKSFAGIVPVPQDTVPGHLAFSPSGAKIAVVGGNRAITWDAATGEISSDFPINGVAELGVVFSGEDYLLVGSQYLIDLENQVKLWQYQGSNYSASSGNQVLIPDYNFIHNGAIMAGQLPHPEALKALEDAKSRGDLFLLKPGDTVNLDVSEIPESHQERVRKGITEQLAKHRIQIGQGAPVTVKASIQGTATTQSYTVFGRGRMDLNVNRQVSRVQIISDGKTAWSQQQDNIPGMIQAKGNESMQDVVTRMTANPNLQFFDRVRLPQVVQKPVGDKASAWQTLGQTRISARGLK